MKSKGRIERSRHLRRKALVVNSAKLKDSIKTTVIVLVAPTIIFYLVGKFTFIDRSIANVDYLFAFVIAYPLGAMWCAFTLSFVLLVDLVFSIAPAYHFSIASVIQSAQDLFELELQFVLLQAAKLLSLCTGYFLIVKIITPSIRKYSVVATICLALAFMLIGLDQRFALGTLNSGNGILANPNIASSTVNSIRIALTTFFLRSESDGYSEAENSASIETKLWSAEVAARHDRIVLIVVESLGQMNDETLMPFQTEELSALGGLPNVRVRTGAVNFHGSTVPGELRELCGIKMLAVHPDPDTIPANECLPERLNQRGYRTTAIHGFSGMLFNRNVWYPVLGFDDVVFATELKAILSEKERCGLAFNGYCDVNIWTFIESKLQANAHIKQFYYWLTLTAHLPIEPASEAEMDYCSDFVELELTPEICALIFEHKGLFQAIATSVRAGRAPNTLIVLVGDHSPPFLTKDTRRLYSQSVVPFIEIAIK